MKNNNLKTYEFVTPKMKLAVFLGDIELDFYITGHFDNALHTHQWYEIFCVQNDAIVCNFENEKFNLRKGEYIIIERNCPHFVSKTSDDAEYIVIPFMADVSKCSKSEASHFLEFDKYKIIEGDDECMDLAIMLQGSIKREDEDLTGAYLYALITKLSQLYGEKRNNLKNIDKDSNMSRVHIIESILAKYFATNITAEEVAELLHISKRHLLRIIKSQYGCTYKQRITMLRMSRAKKLLSDGVSVEETAAKCGWNSVSSFYTAFKKNLGMSPGKFKNSTLG